jgi:hypothetical protein
MRLSLGLVADKGASMGINRAVIITLVMLTGACAAKAPLRESEIGKPKFTLKCSPSVLVRPGRVFCTAIIENPDNRYQCPLVQWFWGDNLRSSHQADCLEDGYIQGVYAKEHFYKSCGEYQPQIILTHSSGSLSARAEVKVHCPQ